MFDQFLYAIRGILECIISCEQNTNELASCWMRQILIRVALDMFLAKAARNECIGL
jgi:hypothetical protein